MDSSSTKEDTNGPPLKFKIASAGFLVDVCVIWPVIFCGLSFALFFAIHPNSRDRVEGYKQIPTFSQTGMLVPESLIFTYGLHVEGALLAVLFTFLFAHFQRKIRAIESKLEPLLLTEDRTDVEDGGHSLERHPSYDTRISCYDGWNFLCCCMCKPQILRSADIPFLTFWNYVLWIMGLICAFLMSLVGTVTLAVEPSVHGVIAFFMYLTAILHMILYYYTIADTMGHTDFQLNLHRACLFVCVPFNIGMMIMIGAMYMTCNNDPCMESAVDLVTALEYTTTIALVVYIYRFRSDLQDIDLTAIAMPAGQELECSSPHEDNRGNYRAPQGQGASTNQERDHTEAIVNLMM